MIISTAQAGKFRDKLKQRAALLREEIRQTLLRSDQEQYIAIAGQTHNAADESFADLLVDVNLAEIDRDLAELRETEAALTRLAEGAYGRCDACGEAIDLARLEVNPAALRCAACQSAFERAHLQKTPRL